MKKFELLAASAAVSALALIGATPATAQTAATTSAQNTAPTNGPGQEATTGQASTDVADTGFGGDIVVTAQRQSQRLQDVPIAVSAFTADNLEKQQIVNPLALQQSLPNVTFTKTNFTSSSFTIRGIGDLCVGVTCDSATAIHVNDVPLLSTRLFESEFLDLERVEVLRGPQGTLFGRNATSGVVNFITAKPDLSAIHAAGEFEYGNYDSKRARAMFNLPLTETLGIRVAGLYLKRDGYTYNQYSNSQIDGRDLYSVRGTLTWEPTSDTRIDLIGYYFHEADNRSRIQKQLCSRDPTGILGCRPDQLGSGTVNANAQLTSIFSSTELINISLAQAGAAALIPLYTPLTTGSIYGPDAYANTVNPAGLRTVNTDFDPRYRATEQQYQLKIFHDFGKMSLNVTGGFSKNTVYSQEDYNLAVATFPASTLATLNAYAGGAAGAAFAPVFAAYRNALIPNGPTGGYCTSTADPNGVGVFGGNRICSSTPQDFDQSNQTVQQYSAEAHVDSKFDGKFNFLLGGIYFDSKTFDNNYYVNAFGLDYTSALLGSISTVGNRAAGNVAYPVVFRGTPFFRNNTARFDLQSYGLFGEAYFEVDPKLKITLGARYNHDKKEVQARTSLYSDANSLAVYVPVGSTSLTQALGYSSLDYDPYTPGNQEYAVNTVSFSRVTGRAVVDYRITPNNLLYFSYSRGYKSGGFNPPLSPSFAVSPVFAPESIDAFEVGSKNTFLGGQLRLNLTGFYYNYKGLQLSRIVSRTSVNDNVNAHIYGIEAEAVISPTRRFTVNANASYLHSRVSDDKFLADTRDPSGGRSDTVIIKDLSNAANCAVAPTMAGNAAGTNAFVAAVNGSLGLRAPVAVPGTSTTGAYSICSALAGAAAAPSAGLRALFATPTGALPFTVLGSGVENNIRGNQLPNAPMWKVAVGAQYVFDIDRWSVVPRADLNYTGNSYASVFNRTVDRIKGYPVVNMQVQINAPDERLYIKGFVQNLTNNSAITGQYVTDQSSGLFTNVFTLEPRRYGAAVGFKF